MKENFKKMRESFVFYKSFFDAISQLDDKKRLKMFDLITNFALNEEEIEPKYKICEQLFTLIKPQLAASNKRFEVSKKCADFGKMGGRPKKEKTLKGFENKTLNVNDNVNVNDNDNVNIISTNTSTNNNEHKFFGEYKNVALTEQQHKKFIAHTQSTQAVEQIIQALSVAIEIGKEKPYAPELPNAHFERLKAFWNWRRKHPEMYLDGLNTDTPEAYSEAYEKWKEKRRLDAPST